MTGTIWVTKLILAHLLTDFILQPTSWVQQRNEKHFLSGKLYLHGLVTAIVAWLFMGPQYWLAAIVILITHTLIDGWKSYRAATARYFVIDQLLHLAVIAGCWYASFMHWEDIKLARQHLNEQTAIWKIVTGFVFLTTPTGLFIGQLTRQWRIKISDAEALANAGKWIGIVERIIVLIFVLNDQYSAIGLLVAAKGIIRFNEKDRPETKTEYLVIGTLLSIGAAVVTGVLVKV